MATPRAPSTAPSPTVTPGPTKALAAIHSWLQIRIGRVYGWKVALSKSCVPVIRWL